MQTWTFKYDGYYGVISADNIEQAKHQIKTQLKIEVPNNFLIPLPVHHRYLRLLFVEGPSNA